MNTATTRLTWAYSSAATAGKTPGSHRPSTTPAPMPKATHTVKKRSKIPIFFFLDPSVRPSAMRTDRHADLCTRFSLAALCGQKRQQSIHPDQISPVDDVAPIALTGHQACMVQFLEVKGQGRGGDLQSLL